LIIYYYALTRYGYTCVYELVKIPTNIEIPTTDTRGSIYDAPIILYLFIYVMRAYEHTEIPVFCVIYNKYNVILRIVLTYIRVCTLCPNIEKQWRATRPYGVRCPRWLMIVINLCSCETWISYDSTRPSLEISY